VSEIRIALAIVCLALMLYLQKAWGKVFAKAQGEKILDNEALLKKSIKRDEHKKKKSAAQWHVTSFPHKIVQNT